jgi:glycosyltransferase involved in cell wall biosynthesis
MIRLSIIVPVYNTEKYLGRCLDSLIQQDIPSDEYEIIVINDGSEDNSAELVARYMSEHPQIRYHEHTNRGLFETRNVGISLAKGKYIYFIDSDDFIAANVMGSITSYMENNEIDLFGFGMIKTSLSTIPTPLIAEKLEKGIDVYDGLTFLSSFDYLKESVWLVIDRDFLSSTQISNLKGIGFSDGLFTTELLYNATRISVIPDKIYAYFQHSESILNNPSSDHYRKLLRRYEATTEGFTDYLEQIEKENKLSVSALERIRSKEISYIFFMLIRAVKSNLSIQEIGEILGRLKSKGYYPIKGFIGSDHTDIRYRILLVILNHKVLLYPSIIAYRSLKTIVRSIKRV